MKKLAEHNRERLVDLLCERLAFERASVRLYNTILGTIDESGGAFAAFSDEMQRFRDQEEEHEHWLERCVLDLGGDPTVRTEMVQLVQRESRGIEEVVERHDCVPHAMHALLAAELVDNAGWELLVELADDADDSDAREAFRKRLHEEEDHLLFVRSTRKEVLGYERRMGGEKGQP